MFLPEVKKAKMPFQFRALKPDALPHSFVPEIYS